MAVDEKYSSIILKRISDSQNTSEQIELISDDNQRISIHRVILTAASKHFATLLGPNRNFQEDNREEGKKFEGADGEILRMIANYCNTGHIKLTEGNVQTFLTIASRYQFDLLEEKCCSFYAGILGVTNCVEALMFAADLNCTDLRKAALDLICKNFESVPTADVQKLDHQLFQEILESDKRTSSEELVFDRLLKWSEHGERKPYVPNLLKLIRLQHFKLEILKGTVAAFYERFGCTELMLAEYRRRASGNHFDRSRSFFCLFAKSEKVNGREHSVIKVSRFNTELRNLEEITEYDLRKRLYSTMALKKNKIYVLGGRLNGVPCNTVSSFDFISRREKVLPNMNISRELATSILYGKHIFVFGGINGSGLLSSCERFNTKRKAWTEIRSMSKARYLASAVVMNGRIYIAGGSCGGITSTFEAYDPMTNVWKELAPMKVSRYSFALTQSNGFIYAIGWGDTIEKYDPSKNEWTKISYLHYSSPITSGINVNGEIYVMKFNGELRQIKIDESDKCSFFPWVDETAYKSTYRGRHFLTLN